MDKWVARCKIFGVEIEDNLSPIFDSVYQCQKYIDNNLEVFEYLLDKIQEYKDLSIDNKFVIRIGNYVRCYNLTQKRWCDGFDF